VSEPALERTLSLFRLAVRSHGPGLSCLPRALALRRVLADQGVRGRLRLGVRGAGRGIEGHAWIEHGGDLLLDSKSHVGSYLPLVRPERRPTSVVKEA
jgi:hypothetical protein